MSSPYGREGNTRVFLYVKLSLCPQCYIQLTTTIQGAVVAIANGIGPVIGGAISSSSDDSWRWIFRMNMPLTVLTTLGVIFFMPLKKVEGDWRM